MLGHVAPGKGDARRTRPRTLVVAVAALAGLLLAVCGVAGLSSFQGFPGGRIAGLRHEALAATRQPPLAPDGLQVTTAGGQTIAPDTWTNQANLRLAERRCAARSRARCCRWRWSSGPSNSR